VGKIKPLRRSPSPAAAAAMSAASSVCVLLVLDPLLTIVRSWPVGIRHPFQELAVCHALLYPIACSTA
jgi:hypothetical protein